MMQWRIVQYEAMTQFLMCVGWYVQYEAMTRFMKCVVLVGYEVLT